MPVHDDRLLFEFLILEGAQAGLTWRTILDRRQNYREAFNNFDARKIARYGARDVKRLLSDAGIIRNRLKIAAAIQNAQRFLEVQQEFGTLRQVHLAIRWRPTDRQQDQVDQADPGNDAGVGQHEQGSEEARLQVCRPHHLLRLHAGRRHGQRPRTELLPAWLGRVKRLTQQAQGAAPTGPVHCRWRVFSAVSGPAARRWQGSRFPGFRATKRRLGAPGTDHHQHEDG